MIKVFIDSSVIIAGLISDEGGSAKILALCESGVVEGWISDKVIEEINEVIARKFPELNIHFKKVVKIAKLKMVKNLNKKLVKEAEEWISDSNDAPILAAAKFAKVDVLLTLDIRHFIRDVEVTKKSKLQIMTPGEFLQGFVKMG